MYEEIIHDRRLNMYVLQEKAALREIYFARKKYKMVCNIRFHEYLRYVIKYVYHIAASILAFGEAHQSRQDKIRIKNAIFLRFLYISLNSNKNSCQYICIQILILNSSVLILYSIAHSSYVSVGNYKK